MYYFYARVSTKAQNEDRQLVAIREFAARECGEEKTVTYVDKQSGKDFNRKNYRKLCRRMKSGDVLVVKSIDRLGRNYTEILDEWRIITKDKGCEIVIIDMPLLDTRSSRDLTGTLISDIVLQLLSYVAETERAFIRQRVIEGVAAAKDRGVRFGRNPAERPADYDKVLADYMAGSVNSREAGRRLGVSHVTFLKWVREDAAS